MYRAQLILVSLLALVAQAQEDLSPEKEMLSNCGKRDETVNCEFFANMFR